MDHVAGYTLLNDLSARDYQFKTPQWMPGKTFDGAAPCGPALVTPDEAGPHDAIEIELTLNGELMQKGSTADLFHSVPALVAYLSKLMTLEPGDVVSTGHARGRGQPARPEGVAGAGRRGRDQLAAAGRARNETGLGRDLDVAAECLGQQVRVAAGRPDRDGGVERRVGAGLKRHAAAVRGHASRR